MIDLDRKDKYSRRVGTLSSDCSVLTASTLDDINQVFYGNGVDSELSATDLSVRYVTADEYHDLIAGVLSDDFEPKTLYVVSSDEINAYNTQVKNVADPVDSKDAANKQWVESVVESSFNEIDSVLSAKLDTADVIMPSTELSASGKAADAKATGTALYTGFTEWEFSGDTQSGVVYTVAITIPEAGYYIYTLYSNEGTLATVSYTTDDISTVVFNVGVGSTITATRRLITPTKTSQLVNDGAPNSGGTPYIMMIDLPYALVTPGEWEFSGNTSYDWSIRFELGEWWNLYANPNEPPAASVQGRGDELKVDFGWIGVTATRASLPGHLCDRAVNKIVPVVSASNEWVWSDGESGNPYFANGYWNIENAVYDSDNDGKWTSPGTNGFKYDEPVAGVSSDTEITFSLTGTKSFYFSSVEYDDETGDEMYIFSADNNYVSVIPSYSETYEEYGVDKIKYNDVEYLLSSLVTYDDTGNTYVGTGVVESHIVTYTTIYGPTITLTMPPLITGHVRDLIARIDLSQAIGVPPIALSGGAFETADGEMPELVVGINLLSFTETDANVFSIAHKEMKPIANGGL